MRTQKKAAFFTISLLAICLLAFVQKSTFASSSYPVLSADKRVNKTTVMLNDVVTVTIDVNGSGTAVPVNTIVKHPVDLVIMMDSSESYMQEIEVMKANFSSLISGLKAIGLNLTVGFISFGNSKILSECPINTDGSVNTTGVRQLTSNTANVTSLISTLIPWGTWEPWGDAIWIGNHWMSWRSDAYKIAILATDEPCDEGRKVPGPLSRDSGEDYNGSVLWDEVNLASSKGIKYITIGGGYCGGALTTFQLRKIANLTGGMNYNFSYAKATDFVKLINSTVTEVLHGAQLTTAGYNVVVTDTVSSLVEIVAGSFSKSPTSQTTNPDGSVTLKWSLGSIKYNESARITYQIKMTHAGQIQTNVDADVSYLDWEGNAASIQLPLPTVTVLNPTIESCNFVGVRKDTFNLTDNVYVNGSGYAPSATYNIYVVNDVTTWSDGMAIPSHVTGTVTTITSNNAGRILPTAVWNSPLTLGKYDIIVDVNGNGKYDAGIDALDNSDVQVTAGFVVIPEYTIGTILVLAGCVVALSVFQRVRRKS
jgi:hypothetical protein